MVHDPSEGRDKRWQLGLNGRDERGQSRSTVERAPRIWVLLRFLEADEEVADQERGDSESIGAITT